MKNYWDSIHQILFRNLDRGTWLALSVEHATLDIRVMSLSPMLVLEITLKYFKGHLGGSVG